MRLGKHEALCMVLLAALCAFGVGRESEAAAATCTRPSGNSGKGFFVGCGRINSPGGTEFRVRGVVRMHAEIAAATSIATTKANAVRTYYAYDSGTIGKFRADFLALQAKGLTPIASMDGYGGILGACRRDPASLAAELTRWVRDAGTWTLLNAKGMIDISSEWGPSGGAAWRDQTVAAVRTLREAGYTMPILIDSGTCSRNQPDYAARAAEVAASDAEHDVAFWFHLDGTVATTAAMQSQNAALASKSRANPQLAFLLGVFGPGSNLPPSTALLKPTDVISSAESNSLGWMAWTWDGGPQGGCTPDSSSMLSNLCNGYTGQGADVTPYGHDVLLYQSLYTSGALPAAAPTPPAEAVQAGYLVNTFTASLFTTGNVDVTNSRAAGFQFYPYDLFNSGPPLTDLQLNLDGSITLLGANTGPNGELVTAAPQLISGKNNTQYHGIAFGGGAVFEATLQFATGSYNASASGGWPAFWSEPLETGVIYAATNSDQWAGQALHYHHGVENDFMEYQSGKMGSALHESWGVYGQTCPPNYCSLGTTLAKWAASYVTPVHRYSARWTPATATTPGKMEYFFDGALQSSASWSQFTSTLAPPPTGQPWAYGALDTFHYVLILGTGTGAPMKVLSVNVWQANTSGVASN